MILFCLPTKPALKFGIIHNNFQRSFQQRSLGIVRKNDLIRSQTEHSSCAAGRRSITCTRGGFPASIIICYILIQRHKKPFSYSTLSFSLLSHSGLEKKKVLWMECLLLFKYFVRKCHLHPQLLLPSLSPLLLQDKEGESTERENKLKNFSRHLN